MIMEDNSGLIADKIWKKLLFPSVLSHICIYVASSLSSFLLISKYCGKDELVVFSLFSPFALIQKIMINFWSDGSSQQFSLLKGAGKKEEAQRIFSEVLAGYLLIGGLIFGILCWQMPLLVRHVLNLGKLCDSGIAFGIPFMAYLFVMTFTKIMLKYLGADSMPRYFAFLSIFDVVLMLVFQTVFIGFLKWNMKGYLAAGFASEIIVLLCCVGIFLHSKQPTLRIRFRIPRLSSIHYLWNFSCSDILRRIGSLCCRILVMRMILTEYGKDIVAIYALGRQLAGFTVAVYSGYIDTVRLLASMFRGAKNNNGLAAIWRKGLLLGHSMLLFFIIPMFVFAPWIVDFMLGSNIDRTEAVWGLRIMILFIGLPFSVDFRTTFYNACGHLKLVSVLPLINEFVVHLGSTALFVCLHVPAHFFWLCWAMYRSGQLGATLLGAEILRRKKGYRNHILLQEQKDGPFSLFCILHQTVEDLKDYREMARIFMKHNNLTSSQIRRSMQVFEELFLFSREEMKDRPEDVCFVSITIDDDKTLEIEWKYDSCESCLNSVLNNPQHCLDPGEFSCVKILRGIADEIKLDRVLGINVICSKVKEKE